MTKLRLAILGAGNVAESYIRQIRWLRDDGKDLELTAICGRTEEAAARLAFRFGIATHGTNYPALLERTDVDAVIILTPMQLHYEHARMALGAGKHVLVEKTLAGTAKDAGSLLDFARSKQRVLIAAPFTPLSPTFSVISQRIASGEIGDVLSARAIYGWAGPDWASWFHEEGAGPLRDLGVYGLTTLTGLIGPVRKIFSFGQVSRARHNIGPPDNFQVSLEFESGCLGVLTTGYVHQKYRVPGIEIYGSSGTIQFVGQDWAPGGYEIWTNEAGCWHQYEAPHIWPWTDGVRDFCEAILEDRQPVCQPDHAIHVLDVIDKAIVSLRSGQSETVTSTFRKCNPAGASEAGPPHLNHNPLNLR